MKVKHILIILITIAAICVIVLFDAKTIMWIQLPLYVIAITWVVLISIGLFAFSVAWLRENWDDNKFLNKKL